MSYRTLRRRVGVALVAASALAAGLVSPMAHAAATPPAALTDPPAGIRGHALWDSWYDLAPFGYEQHEYFASGTVAGGTVPYTTRIIVTKPIAGAHAFNGTAILDWTNVTAQFENAVDTMESRQMLMREGFAYVHVSAQSAGICCTPLTPKVWDPVRYQALNHPGDTYANEMFSQIAVAVRNNLQADGLRNLIAVGQSQSCSKLESYILSAEGQKHLIDGFLVHGCDSTKSISGGAYTTKVLQLLSDNEANPQRPVEHPNPNYRLWEVAGTAHSDYFIGYQSEVGSSARVVADQPPQDKAGYDTTMTEAGNYGAELHPMLATCIVAGSTMPMHYAVSAAIYQLNRWVRDDDDAPATSPAFAFDSSGSLAKDADMNSEGGIRMPPIEHAVATYDSTQCPLGGLTIPFTDQQIQQRYPDFVADYYTPMAASTDAAVRAGWMLRTDAVDMMKRVCAAQSRWGTAEACPAYSPPPSPWGNKG